jgi:hypothetical protein
MYKYCAMNYTGLTSIWKIPDSSVGPRTGYPDIFMVFLRPSREITG